MEESGVSRGKAAHWIQLALLAALYFGAAKLALTLAIAPGYASAAWPPSGIAVAALLLFGNRLWPAIWCAAALVNLSINASMLAAVTIASGNTLEALIAVYPRARFLWTHRDPAEVMGSVCDLICYTRSWVSDRDDTDEIGEQQLGIWTEAVRRGLDVRDRVGEERFADVYFRDLNADPVGTVEGAYARLGLSLGDVGRRSVGAWAAQHTKDDRGAHEYSVDEFGLDPDAVRHAFGFYLDRFGARIGV